MLRTKAEVDRHVAKSLAKIKSAREKQLRGYSFARLYFEVGDYEACVQFASRYLQAKGDNASAHALLAQAFAKVDRKQEAVAEYKAALELDPTQKNLIVKVCELLLDESLNIDDGIVRYWSECAMKSFPSHPTALRLYRKTLSSGNADVATLIGVLRDQIEAQPTDVPSHVHLVKQLIQCDRTPEAFEFVLRTQLKNLPEFNDSISWQDAVIECYRSLRTEEPDRVVWTHWFSYLTALDRKVLLQLSWKFSVSEACDALKDLDSALYGCQKLAFTKDLLMHFGGQFFLHAATLLLKKATKEQKEWREMVLNATPLLLLAYQTEDPDLSKNNSAFRSLTVSWRSISSHRKSQAGHTLSAIVKNKKQMDSIAHFCNRSSWREEIHKELFGVKYQHDRSSHLIGSAVKPAIQAPNVIDLHEIDNDARLFDPKSLHLQIWIGVNSPKCFKSGFPTKGSYSTVDNLPNCGPETLSNFDIDAFLYCAIAIAQENEKKKKEAYNVDRPLTLPMIITEPLCTVDQSKWWENAISFLDRGVSSSDSRSTLIYGIETVRCAANNGLDPYILVTLGRLFSQRADADQEKKQPLLKRATLYYSAALPLLERLRDNISVLPTKKRMFNYTHKDLSNVDLVSSLIDEIRLFLGKSFMEREDYDRAIEMLTNVRSPYASFYLFKIYMKLADDQVNLKKEHITSEMRIKRFNLLSKARNYIYVTSDRLKDSNAGHSHPLSNVLNENIENVETLLSYIDFDTKHVSNEPEYISDEESSTIERSRHVESTPEKLNTSANLSRSLEAQVRQLQKKEMHFATMLEHITTLLDSNKLLSRQVEDFRSSLDEIKGISSSDNEKILSCVDELRNETSSSVKDLKKEISELRKEVEKLKITPQRPEEDIYLLDDAYRTNPYLSRMPPNPYSLFQPHNFYPFYTGQYPTVPQVFPTQMVPQDQSIYSDLLMSNQMQLPQVQIPTTQPAPVIAQNVPKPPQNYTSLLPVNPVPTTKISASTFQSGTSAGTSSVHDYQIPLPATSQQMPQFLINTQTSTPNKAGTDVTTTPSKPFSLLNHSDTPKSLEIFNISKDSRDLSRISDKLNDNFDPCHDYKPIIPLPDEIVPTTGEENEVVLFEARAKLYRFISPEWKERGLGVVKILRHKDTGKVRLLMRRDTVHTICANHIITPDMELSTNKGVERTYFWVANDYADGTMESEKFCIKFKTPDISKNFYNVFNSCKGSKDGEKVSETWKCNDCSTLNDVARKFCSICETEKLQTEKSQTEKLQTEKSQALTVGGLTFTKPPTVKPVSYPSPQKVVTTTESSKPNPFASFSFTAPKVTTTVTTPNPQPVVENVANLGWGDKFKLKPGMWTCNACYVANEASTDYCIACESPKLPGMPKKDKKLESAANNTFLFGMNNSTAFKFGMPEVPTEQAKIEPKKDEVSFKFGMSEQTKVEPKKNEVSFNFGTQDQPKKDEEKTCTFGSLKNEKYEFVFTPKSPQANNKSIGEEADEDGDDEHDDEGHHIMFEPIVPLPNKIDVKTGEEDEKILYSHRAKLFRFADAEWKECGVGDVKILHHNQNKKIRVIMRREPILKICLNHALTEDIDYLPKDERTWLFSANDFSKGEICATQFCIRFINKTVANEFKIAIDKAKDIIKGVADESIFDSEETKKESEDDDDVIFVSETVISDEDIKLAKKLMLPEKFFAYKQLPECPGCVGCIYEDKVIFAKPEKKKAEKSTAAPEKPLSDKSQIFANFNQLLSKKESEAKPAENQPIGSLFNFSDFKMPQNDGQSIFGGTSVFSKNIFAPAANVFGTNTAEAKPGIKPQQSIFGSFTDNTTSNAPNIFSVENLKQPAFKFAQKEPTKVDKSNIENESTDEDDDINPEEEGNDMFFKPVIPLPNEVPVTTGEEDEDVLYSHKAKLYRFITQEWKECGVGDVKILKHKSTKKLRVLMRRTPIMKICLNHILTSEIEYTPKDESSWLFQACDFSTGVFTPQQYCIKFANKNVAGEFKSAVDSACKSLETEEANIPANPTPAKTEFGNESQNKGKLIFGGTPNLFQNAPSLKPLGKSGEMFEKVFGEQIFKNGNDALQSANENYFTVAVQSMNSAKSGLNSVESAADEAKPFTWAGAGAPIFGQNNAERQKNEDGGEEETYDPHYDPIVPMPNEIVVVTGEEDERVEFTETAKLYRFSNNEWKERGFGDLKILHHPERQTYRLLLRQKQVHKLVLNQLITSELEINPMKNSPKSYMWYGLNYTDDEQGAVEHLAVRFKKESVAESFLDKITTIIKSLPNANAEQENCESDGKNDGNISYSSQPNSPVNIAKDAS